MITKLYTVKELKRFYVETVISITNKISKVSNTGVLNAVAYGVGKLFQKALKESALIESNIFVDSSYGSQLDGIAEREGVAARFGASQSGTYLRLVGTAGTTYLSTTHTFTGGHGIVFQLTEDIIIPTVGYIYAKVRSVDVGLKTNVEPLTVNQISPSLVGHDYVINEYYAEGGRDSESDEFLRKRIKETPNIIANTTLSYYTQVFLKFNTDILDVYHLGYNDDGKLILGVSTQNGINLTSTELGNLLDSSREYFGLSELKPFGNNDVNVILQNIEYQEITLDFRLELISGADPDTVRKETQIETGKLLDFRFWNVDNRLTGLDFLYIIKNHRLVNYIPERYFYSTGDIFVPKNKLPRINSFIMRDLDGTIISDSQGNLDPIYYPNDINEALAQTVL